MKKVPMRTCVVTREKLPKCELLRIVKTDSGIIVDITGKVNGHGCYIKKDENVVLEAKKKKIFNRVLETDFPEEKFSEILNIINKEK